MRLRRERQPEPERDYEFGYVDGELQPGYAILDGRGNPVAIHEESGLICNFIGGSNIDDLELDEWVEAFVSFSKIKTTYSFGLQLPDHAVVVPIPTDPLELTPDERSLLEGEN